MQRPRLAPRRGCLLSNPATGFVAAMTKTKSLPVTYPIPGCRLEGGAAHGLLGDPKLMAILSDASGSRCHWGTSQRPRTTRVCSGRPCLALRSGLLRLWPAARASIGFSSLLCHPDEVVSGGDWVAAETPPVRHTENRGETESNCHVTEL